MSDNETELAPIRSGEELDWPRLEAWLRERITELPNDAMAVQQFPRGAANLTYLLSFGPQQLVLRRPPFGRIAPHAHDMARENSILSKLWKAWPRAPRSYAFCDDSEIIGAAFVVQEYRNDGVVIFGEAPLEMAGLPDLGMRLTKALTDALAELHKVDYAAIDLSDLGNPDGFVERQVTGWRDRWNRVASAENADRMTRVGYTLFSAIPASNLNAIVHNDYKLDNCQFIPGEPDCVVSVFDWDMATLGDPLIDVGIALAYWPYMRRAESLNLPEKEVFGRIYAEKMGINPDQLKWHEAFANWRNAVAVQQLYDRYTKGDSNDDRLANVGRSVITFLERAEQVLESENS